MRDPIQWIALFGMIVIGVLFAVEVRKWRLLGAVMGRGQRILRAVMFLAVEALFTMMLIGPLVTGRKDPITSLLYWTACLVMGLLVVVLVMLDCRAVVIQYARMNRRIFQELKDPTQDDRPET